MNHNDARPQPDYQPAPHMENWCKPDSYSLWFAADKAPDTLILNMGPQHPSTHGVLRILVELDGEYVRRADPVIGYCHRMQEKMAENRTASQFLPNTGRIDYLHPLAWNWAYVAAVEKLAGIVVPERAEYIRVIAAELNRISSHLMWWGSFVLDLGGVTPILYAFDDRETISDALQELTGSRLTFSSFRFGGLAADASPRFLELTRAAITRLRPRLQQYKKLVDQNIIFRRRCEGIGRISLETARLYGATGPVLRASGLAYDVRRAEPYSIYDRFEFEVPAYTESDVMARYLVRMEEIEQSIRIIEQALDYLPKAAGGHLPDKPLKATFRLPAGEVYLAMEGGRGKIGLNLYSDGGKFPYRLKLRSPSYSNLSLYALCVKGVLIADAICILGSLDLIIPELDR